jgi:dephospho-CoA kinase
VGGGGEFLEGAEENENLTGENSDKEVRDCLEPGGAIWKDPVKWYAHHVKDIETSVDIAEFRRRFWNDAVTK